MPLRAYSLAAMYLLASMCARAQNTPVCECTDPGSEVYHAPDTIFHVREGFDVAYCGKIDRSVTPFVYSEFTMRTCGLVQVPVIARGALKECNLSVEHSVFVLDDLAILPTGADMHLERRPCWRTEHRLFVADDGSASAIGAPTTELIAKFQEPTPEQFAQVQARVDAMHPSAYWMDQELLGQVFLCALFDPNWASSYRELREKYMWGGTNAELYDEFLKVLHDRRK